MKKLIGLISDTHDNMDAITAAVRRFNDERVGLVLHAGDFISPFAVRAFGDLEMPMIAVLGNNDGDLLQLASVFNSYDHLSLRGTFTSIRESGVSIGLYHGTEPDLLESLIESGGFDVLVHGHTHIVEQYIHEDTLVINPGEACGYISGKQTMALLDLQERNAQVVYI